MRRLSLAIILILVTSSFASFAAELTQADRDRLRSLYQEARAAQTEKKHARANEVLQEVLRLLPAPEGSSLDPNIARVHYDIASNHAVLGNDKDALQSLDRAVRSGFWNHDFLSRDESFRALRENREFIALLDRARRGLSEVAFGLKDLGGKEILKKDHEGKVLVIDVWGTWCPPCRAEIPHFMRLQEKYGKDGLAVIGLTWERRPPDDAARTSVERFCKEKGVNYTVALLPESVLRSIPALYSFPTTFYVGRDGTIAHRVSGAEPYESIEAKVLPLLAARPAPPLSPDRAASAGPPSASDVPPAPAVPSSPTR